MEVDYIDESSIANSMAIVNEDKRRIKVIAASTPSGDRKSFYRWCNNATHSFDVDSKLLEETGECRYNYTYRKGSQGNGWTHIHASSYVNRKLLEVNPETGMTGIEELRQELTEMKFLQEVMAEFGESETGVYQKKYIDQAVENGQHLGIRYVTDYYGHNLQDFKRMGPRILGIDWDCRGNPTNMVGVQYIEQYGVFAPFLRVEIPQTEFTYDNAVKKVIELHKVFNFDWIFCDAGAGEAQIQFLKKYGLEHPETGLHYKVVRVNFSEKIEVRDPFTYERIKQHIKPFMVNNTVRLLERGQLVFNPEDHIMIKQFTDYHVVQWGKDGRPVYTDENEHIHDCVILAIHGFILKYTDILSVRRTVSVKQLGKVEYGQERDNYLTKSRSSALEEKEVKKDNVMFGKIKSPRRKSYMAMPTRRMF